MKVFGVRPATVPGSATPLRWPAWQVLIVPVLIIAGLLVYKGTTSVLAIQEVWSSGTISARPDVVAFGGMPALTAAERTLHYFAVIWPALVFGILIAAAVRAFIPPEWFARLFEGGTLRPQLRAGLAGAPLMLCSCCVAPVFSAVYERSSRLGPSLAIMLAAPSLNPAAMVLTFTLFAPKIAAARLVMAAAAVILGGVVGERFFAIAPPMPAVKGQPPQTAAAFIRSLGTILLRTIPVIVLGVLGSMFLNAYAPDLLRGSSSAFIVIATASLALILALPTFFEIPLALGLLAAGAPPGAVVVLLFAGPAVNLPSLLNLAKSTTWKIAASVAVLIWVIAVAGGLLLN